MDAPQSRPSVGRAELLLLALGKAGLTIQASPVEVWVQARNAGRAISSRGRHRWVPPAVRGEPTGVVKVCLD